MAKRDQAEIRQAVARLNDDGELLSLTDLRYAAGASPQALQRWVIQGARGGVFLDAIHRPGMGWLSSWAALKRFKAKLAEVDAQRVLVCV